jgi:DNA-binding transcriptional regulator WhiA
MLYGILSSKGANTEERVTVRIGFSEAVEPTMRLIREFFGREAVITKPREGGRGSALSFESPAAARMLDDILMLDTVTPPEKCDGCRTAFLQGVFLACGRVSDPQKKYCLEFSLGKRVDIFWKTFGGMGLFLKSAHKETESVLYSKNSTTIEDFFALSGMNQAAFRLMNSKINADLRNETKRMVNCETNNIRKAVSASGRQIQAIVQLEKSNLLSSLPDELERTARLRLMYPDLSLTQLAAVSVPPVSKSGLSHRLKRIMDFCEETFGRTAYGNEDAAVKI